MVKDTIIQIVDHLKKYSEQKIGDKTISVSCQVTVFILLTFCTVISSQQYFGKPIECMHDEGTTIPEKVMNSFCFMRYTFSRVPEVFTGEIIHSQEENSREHSYYPWVPLIIFLQGLSFMTPQIIWSLNGIPSLEWSLMESKTSMKQNFMPIITRYLSKRLNYFDGVMMIYLLSEVVFVANIVGNFILTDTILGGSFLDYGYKAWLKGEVYRDTIFPKMTKCKFYMFGPSGTLENKDILCLMTLNLINEKMYLMLWYWFLFMFLLAIFILLRRAFFLFIFAMRHFCPICMKASLARNISPNGFSILTKKLTFSDWLLMERIKSNMDENLYTKLLENIAVEISEPNDLILTGVTYSELE